MIHQNSANFSLVCNQFKFDDGIINNANEMLEVASLLLSLFLFGYGIRMLLFLYKSQKYHAESTQIVHQSPPISMLKTLGMSYNSNHVTTNQNIVFRDNARKGVLHPDIAPNYSRPNYNEFLENLDSPELRLSSHLELESYPVVSLVIATYNEESVIENLLKSLEMLTYDRNKWEVIVVDDSTDSTSRILEEWTKRMENLKIIKRSQRFGWKGGALNLALEYLRKDSAWIIILDADMILPLDIIEKFLGTLYNSKKKCNAIQGYCLPYNNYFKPKTGFSNWVSKGVEFRLAQRNIIEFVARDKLDLPVQITGSLFMIKSSILKELGFSTDICEDWDLTLQLYLRENDKIDLTDSKNNSRLCESNILFEENLNAESQMPTSFSSYFKQRLRVSEGHTRGFIKMIPKLIKHKQPLKNKIEIFLTGCLYLRYIIFICLLILDLVTLIMFNSNIFNIYSILCLSVQLFCLISIIITNVLAVVICNKSRHYDLTFLVSKLFLDICTFPALVIGSLLAVLRKKGTFYRTERIAGNIQISKE